MRNPRTPAFSGPARVLAVAIGVAPIVCAILLLASPASAHTGLRSSDPEAGAALRRTPTSIRLTFTQDIAPEFVRVGVTKGGSGNPRRLETRVSGPRVVATVPEALVEKQVPEVGRVPWRVDYRVVSADGHPIEGSLQFTTPRQDQREPSPSPETPRETRETDAAAGRSAEDPSPSPSTSTSPDSGGPVISTLVIGALVATAGLGAASWLSRARKRGEG